jgi:tRNA(Ile)-lysidine synthase
MEPISKPDAMKQLHLSLPLNQLPASVTRLFVAFSGGIDSTVLLHLLLKYRQQYRIVLWHINHGLQHNAASMESLCLTLGRSYGLESRIDKLCLNADAGNLEANARAQRYDLFSSALGRNDALLTAHHMNDQAETLLLNMMRGSGTAGLRAIAQQKGLGQGTLFRPLLNTAREDIEAYAKINQLEWIEDPSNQSLQFDRNYIRHQIMPLLNQRWPAAVRKMHQVCEWQNESHALLSELAQIDYVKSRISSPFSCYSCLLIDKVTMLRRERQKNLIRHWLNIHGKALIGHRKLDQLLANFELKPDALPAVEGDDYCVRLYQGGLYITDNMAETRLKPVYSCGGGCELDIDGIGFSESRQNILRAFKLDDYGQTLQIHFRVDLNSQSIYSHRLKRLFQKHRVPPWLRSVTPQVVIDGELVGLWLI